MLSRREILIGSGCAIAAREARTQPADDGVVVLRATASGFDGTLPGPVIRVRRGIEFRARLVNAVGESIAIHWHGIRLANPMDGAPPLTQLAVAPGESFDYRFVAPDAGTFWYHAPAGTRAADALCGALIVEENEPPAVDRDHLVVLADAPETAPPDAGSPRGPRLTVNGGRSLDLAARTHERLRLRIVNAAAARPISAHIESHGVVVVALDGEPAEPFVPRDSRIVLGPGNRADVLVDAALAPGSIAAITFETLGAEVPVARIVYEGSGPARAAAPGEPPPLQPNALPARMNFPRALRHMLALGAGRAAAAVLGDKPLFTAERGRTVVMALDNRGAAARAVHLHGHHFRLLDRLDDGWKPYWLDTILVAPRQTARIAFVADNPGRWLVEDRPLDGSVAATWFHVA